MRVLQSYLEGRFVTGAAPNTELHNAYTGEVCASTSTNGLDRGAALAYARNMGGPALRAMTFAERGAMIKRMSEVIHGARDHLIDLATENSGNTRGDAKFDIDGASGTLAYYANLGRKMGDRTHVLDGGQLKITRSPRFVGQHLYTARQGVAIHINAFNFPAWNMCEKAACALLAGMPVLTKPGTATCVVSARIMELWAEAEVFPKGAYSLLAGSAGDLLDHVQRQDVIVFTGSGDTGARIRGHERVLALNVRVNIEADSLNAAVLGPKVEPGSDTFHMFISDVARDMTQKAGQKCTAIRRAFVPSAVQDAVLEALTDRLDMQIVGDPRERATTISPVASAAQQRDVNAGLAQLTEAAEVVWQQTDIPQQGYYVTPTLFKSDKGLDTPFVHEHEVFGPASTVLTWSGDAADVVAMVNAGGGGLVASVYSDDKAWAGQVLLGLAPYHGRLHWGSRKVHDQSPGPGTVLPTLVHGGPGKAGGGEELGGERGLAFYWTRTALQGDRALLERVFGKNEE